MHTTSASVLKRAAIHLWLLLLIPSLSYTQSITLNRISFAHRSDKQGEVVRLHTSAYPDAYSIQHNTDSSLTITLFNTNVSPTFKKDAPLYPVTRYKVHTDTPNRTLITLFYHANYFLTSDIYPDRNKPHLLLTLLQSQTPSPSATLPPLQPEQWKLDCVVIDPGHGGRDPGALGRLSNGKRIKEKDIALNIARILGNYIEKNLGIRVVYTRRDDRFIPLRERGHIANQECGKLFISLHANALKGKAGRRARGTETYFLGLHKTDAARRVMEQENAVIKLEQNPEYYTGFDESALILQTLTQSFYLQASERLAELVEHEMAQRAKRHSRGVHQAGFLVLWAASMPAILIELGFLSNPREAAFLTSRRGQEILASAIFRAVRTFKTEYEKGLDFALDTNHE